MQRSSKENTLKDYIERNDGIVQSLAASMRNLEVQIGQIAIALNVRLLGTLPSDVKDARKNSANVSPSEVLKQVVNETLLNNQLFAKKRS
ncbi:hypothetical protein V6N13_024645 [Hibiscus sabdariffa]